MMADVRIPLLKSLLFIVFVGCSSDNCESFGEYSIGDKYAVVLNDNGKRELLYCTSSTCCFVGVKVGPEILDKCYYNRDQIIAVQVTENNTAYWIIDKKKEPFQYDQNLKGELDSLTHGPFLKVELHEALESFNIKLSEMRKLDFK